MRRQDVKIGVEYAATAPLAYGHEPRTRPVKVRFTDTRPGPWVRIITQRRQEGATALGTGVGWATTDVVIKRQKDLTDEELELPRSMREAMERGWGKVEEITRKRVGGTPYQTTQVTLDVKKIPVGATIIHIDNTTRGLPGERWRFDQEANEWRWFPTIIETAAVHRTWTQWQDSQREKNERIAALDAEAKVPEIQALLHAAGLNLVFDEVRRNGSSTRIIIAAQEPGERLLGSLIDWADTMMDDAWRLRYRDALTAAGITDERWQANP